jgi:hypothetical protein
LEGLLAEQSSMISPATWGNLALAVGCVLSPWRTAETTDDCPDTPTQTQTTTAQSQRQVSVSVKDNKKEEEGEGSCAAWEDYLRRIGIHIHVCTYIYTLGIVCINAYIYMYITIHI